MATPTGTPTGTPTAQKMARAFQPSNPSLPPLAPLNLTPEQYDYRAELIKQLMELRKTEQAWRSGIMDTWSTQKLAREGLRAKLVASLVSGDVGLAQADATALLAKGGALKMLGDHLELAAQTDFFGGNQEALKRIRETTNNAYSVLLSSNDETQLDRLYDNVARAPAGDKNRALYQEFRGHVDHQSKMDTVQNALKEELALVPEAERYDTAKNAWREFAESVTQKYGSDPRFAELVPEYLAEAQHNFIAAGNLNADTIKAGEARHAEAAKTNKYYYEQVASLARTFKLNPKTLKEWDDLVTTAKEAEDGDPAALNDMLQAIAKPEDIAHSERLLQSELDRMAGDSNQPSARSKFIAAFDARAGRGDAFVTWANAMGFRGKAALERAASFAAQYPGVAMQFIDASKADPTLMDPAGGYANAKAAMKAMGHPVGTAGIYRMFHKKAIYKPEDAVRMSEAEGIPATGPITAPVPEPTASPVPAETAAPVEAAPAVVTPPPGESGNRVSVDPDGRVILTRPDGSTMALGGPPLAQAAPEVPAAPRTLDLGEETILANPAASVTTQTPSIAAGLASKLGPAVAPSDIPATAASDMRHLLVKQRLQGLVPPEPLTPQPVQ